MINDLYHGGLKGNPRTAKLVATVFISSSIYSLETSHMGHSPKLCRAHESLTHRLRFGGQGSSWKGKVSSPCAQGLTNPSQRDPSSSRASHAGLTLASLSLPPDLPLICSRFSKRNVHLTSRRHGKGRSNLSGIPAFADFQILGSALKGEPSSPPCSCPCPFGAGWICCRIILSKHLPPTKLPPLDVGR